MGPWVPTDGYIPVQTPYSSRLLTALTLMHTNPNGESTIRWRQRGYTACLSLSHQMRKRVFISLCAWVAATGLATAVLSLVSPVGMISRRTARTSSLLAALLLHLTPPRCPTVWVGRTLKSCPSSKASLGRAGPKWSHSIGFIRGSAFSCSRRIRAMSCTEPTTLRRRIGCTTGSLFSDKDFGRQEIG